MFIKEDDSTMVISRTSRGQQMTIQQWLFVIQQGLKQAQLLPKTTRGHMTCKKKNKKREKERKKQK
jgi:hypothetical protein